jgi:hypothetical protein
MTTDLFGTDDYANAVAMLLRARTEEEAVAARVYLRKRCDTPLRLVMWGYRQPRKRRAGTDYALRRPTKSDLQEAWDMLREGRRAHDVETYFAETRNIRVSRNRLSRLCGARP